MQHGRALEGQGSENLAREADGNKHAKHVRNTNIREWEENLMRLWRSCFMRPPTKTQMFQFENIEKLVLEH